MIVHISISYKMNNDLADERRDIFRKANNLEEIPGIETETIEEKKEGEIVPVEEPKKEEAPKKPIKRRMTTKEVYGYHWMGLIYDE